MPDEAAQQQGRASHLSHLFRSLRYRNFRLFFIGQGLSLIGTWMQSVAISWLTYRLTDSSFLLGVVVFTGQIPTFILSPFAGVVADRRPRRQILLATQTLAMLQAFTLAALAGTGIIEVWHILGLSFCIGCVYAFDIPCRQSFLIDMVEGRENLSNAISLNSLMFNSARLVGPAIAGLVLSYSSEAVCFLINALSFLAVLLSLFAMRITRHGGNAEQGPVLATLYEGFKYTFGSLPIRLLLITLCIMNLAGTSYMVILPVFAKLALNGNSVTFGFLTAACGVGALLATVFLAYRRSILGLGRMIARASFLFSLGIVAFSLSRQFLLCCALLAFSAFWLMSCLASCNIILQTIVDDDKRGRVMSFYTMAFMGTMPIGSLAVGALADHIGVTSTICLQAACCLGGSLYFARELPSLREALRPRLLDMGIIPPAAPNVP